MKDLEVKVKLTLVFLLIGNILSKTLNKSILIDEFGYATDSVLIDLSFESIDSIDLNTFNEYVKLEELYLQENKLSKLEAGLLSNLVNLRQSWLESNFLVSIDKNIFNGLNNLELVCLSNNPISTLFSSHIASLCSSSNPKCQIKPLDKCQRKETTTNLQTTTTTSINIFIYLYKTKYIS